MTGRSRENAERHTECELYGAREATRFKASLRAACWSFHCQAAKHPVRSASSAAGSFSSCVRYSCGSIWCRRQVLVRLARIAKCDRTRVPTKGNSSGSHDAFHLTLTYIVIDGNRAIRAENVQLRPVIQSVVHRIGHGMLRDQLLLPNQQLLPQFGQHGHRLFLRISGAGGRSFPGLVLYGEEGRSKHDLTAISGAVFPHRQPFRLA